jgi:hypothetical protein
VLRSFGATDGLGQMSGNWLIVFVGAFVAGLIGLFLYGWLRRKDKPPPGVKPLKDDDDDW